MQRTVIMALLGKHPCLHFSVAGNSEQRLTQRPRDAAQHFWNEAETEYTLDKMKNLNILHLLGDVCSYFPLMLLGIPNSLQLKDILKVNTLNTTTIMDG